MRKSLRLPDGQLELLDESIAALLAPFSRATRRCLSASTMVRYVRGWADSSCLANVKPGAGMHELVGDDSSRWRCPQIVDLASGARVLSMLSRTDAAQFVDRAHRKSLLEVVTFGREREDLTHLMLNECDFIVALGDDASLARLNNNGRLFGFGSRTSGALISLAAPANVARLATAIARDVVLFEQQGCLSPHHVSSSPMPTTRRRAVWQYFDSGNVLTWRWPNLALRRRSIHSNRRPRFAASVSARDGASLAVTA